MPPFHDRNQDIEDARCPDISPRLVTDLRIAYRRPPVLDTVDSAIKHAIEVRMAQRDTSQHKPRGGLLHARLSVPMAALAAITLTAGAYLHGQSPTPVSAQEVLQRAVAVNPGPGEATHATYLLSAGGGLTGTSDVWVGAGTQGIPTDFALTQSVLRNGQPAPELGSRLVQTDRLFQVYDPANNAVTTSSSGRPVQVTISDTTPSTPVQGLEGMFMGTLVARKLGTAPPGKQVDAFSLQQETLDGVSVYALRLNAGGGNRLPYQSATQSQTFYFNAQSYVLEGIDWLQGSTAWHAQLDDASYRTMARSAVPANTFTLTAPASAKFVTLDPGGDSSRRPGQRTVQPGTQPGGKHR